MPITLTTPFLADGKEYPFVAVQIIISPEITPQAVTARTVVNFRPFRIDPDTGLIDARPQQEVGGMKSLLMSDAFAVAQGDPHIAAALDGIVAAFQQFINAKGL